MSDFDNKNNNDNIAEKNPNTGLFTGFGFIMLMGVLSYGIYKVMKKKMVL